MFSGYQVSFPGIKQQWREADYSPLSGAEVKNGRSYNFTSLVAWTGTTLPLPFKDTFR
jgi:hypothetical protein